MLKALGLIIWGLIALGLLAIFILVGFEASLKYRAPHNATANQGQPVPPGGIGPSAPASTVPAEQQHEGGNGSAPPRTPDATRKLLLNAVQDRHYDSAIEYGLQLIDEKSAEPADLSIVAQAYLSVSDCINAQAMAQESRNAFQAAGLEPDDALGRVTSCCGRTHNKPRIVLDAARKARIDRLLSRTEAAKADSGDPFVRLGELYYGYGEFELAIESIQLGLQKGKISHLDEAYVYLGRAEQAVGDLEEARNAFNRLKEVPGISPRVLRLWTLYAETQLRAPSSRSASEGGNCPT